MSDFIVGTVPLGGISNLRIYLQLPGILLLSTLHACSEGGSAAAPIPVLEAMVHNMLHHKNGDQDDQEVYGNHGDGDGWRSGIDLRLFYSYRNFLKNQMRYNMNLRG